MVRSAGFEPTTPGLGILCSILLSYERLVPMNDVIDLDKLYYFLQIENEDVIILVKIINKLYH